MGVSGVEVDCRRWSWRRAVDCWLSMSVVVIVVGGRGAVVDGERKGDRRSLYRGCQPHFIT